VQQVSLFARKFAKFPDGLEIGAYQAYLTNEKRLAAGSIVIATAALRFRYWVALKRD
jgi:hypothetical protein